MPKATGRGRGASGWTHPCHLTAGALPQARFFPISFLGKMFCHISALDIPRLHPFIFPLTLNILPGNSTTPVLLPPMLEN